MQALGDQVAAGVSAKGYEVMGERTPATGFKDCEFSQARD